MLFRKRHPLEDQAVHIAETMRGKLTRMGLRHRAKGREYDELYQVEFRQVEASPDFVRLRIDVDVLPEGVTTARLKSEEVLTDLGHTLGHPVTFEDRDKKQGCWFVVHLGERDGIPRLVRFDRFLESYPEHPAPLTIPIGHGLQGPVWRDLRDMPHLLIAGATGKGKSVMVHAILGTALALPPQRLRVVLADLKGGMTLGKYKRVPHLSKEHYVRRAEDLPLMLLALQTEMQRRAEAMENVAEDIDEWNRTRVTKWPYILLVVEELANAMLAKKRIKLPGEPSQTIGAATEGLLADLAARGRATGIHIIATTQTPRADVISGIIKANFPVRIAFGTASDIDSRIIIDDSRAQGLAKGRMIYLDCADYTELQAPYMTEADRAHILQQIRAGVPWLTPRTKEQRLVEDIHLLLTVAERDFDNTLVLHQLTRSPDLKQAQMTPDRIGECLAVLVADGVVVKPFLRDEYRLKCEGAVWREKYRVEQAVSRDWDATNGDIIDGEVIDANTTSIPPQRLLKEAQYQPPIPDLATDIRRWDNLGYSRNQMVERLGMDRNAALQMITFILGPARRTPTQEEPCSVQS
jgi:hypothetical protein